MAKIFLNYRRDDADVWADTVYKPLKERFGDVFMDIDGQIPVGLPWADWLDQQVQQCDALVALIGRRWADEFEARSGPSDRDFVRVEIESALARGIPMVPVFLGEAPEPEIERLPASVRPLLDRQAVRVRRGRDLDGDLALLVHGLEQTLKHVQAPSDAETRAAELDQAHIVDQVLRQLAEDDARDARLAASPAGTVFRDTLAGGGEGPEMVVIPAGRFMMGSPPDEPERRDTEGPQHEVTFARPFALGRYAVTFDEYDAFCVAAGRDKPSDAGWGRGRRPTINVSWEDATAYCTWLSEQIGAAYRLPSEAEWEYACRAGTTTSFWWGREITPDQANYDGNHVYAGGWAKGFFRKRVFRETTEPVDAFEPNPWGLYQAHGNVWEWCADAWNKGYRGAPQDGSAWMFGNTSLAVLRGGCWISNPQDLRSASRDWHQRYVVGIRFGFRLARTLVE